MRGLFKDFPKNPGITPTGAILDFAGATAPTGWLLCDGSAVSRNAYAKLFATIGTGYGVGDGSTTFNIPDFRGRVAVGKGTHTDVDALGDSDGQATIGSRRPHHKHTVVQPTVNSHDHGGGSHTHPAISSGNAGGSNSGYWEGANTNSRTVSSSGAIISPQSPGTSGGTVGPQSNVPVDDSPAYLVVNRIIKT